jgi:carbamoyl-phosphate synthase large subunit
MLRDITVLLTGAGAPGAPGIIKCLRKNGERNIKIVGVDMNDNASGRNLVDVFRVVPPAGKEKFISSILDICRQENVDVILPLVTRELDKFAKAKAMFAQENIKVAVMDFEFLEVANNKGRLLSALKKSSIPVPEFYIINNVRELEEACAKLGYPEKAVCVKVIEGNGSRGVRIVNPFVSKYELFFNEKPNSMLISYDEILLTFKEKESIPEIMVMEYLPGKEYSVDVLADCGEPILSICRYGTRVVSSIQLDCVIVDAPSLIKLSTDICRSLKLDGNIGLDIKLNMLGDAMIMEINPRLTTGIVAFAAAGVNLPYLGIKKLLGEPFDIPSVQYGTKMIRYWQEVFMDKNDQIITW